MTYLCHRTWRFTGLRRTVRYGTASLGIHVTNFLSATSKPASSGHHLLLNRSVIDGIRTFASSRGGSTSLDMIVLLSFAEGKRMVAFAAVPGAAGLSEAEFERVVSDLCSSSPLQLARIETTFVDDVTLSPPLLIHVFAQGASTASRKQVVPLLDRSIAAALA
jgi:hypothetical protein